jgi:hypothetical protein
MSIKITLRQLEIANQTKALAAVSDLVPPGGYHFRVAKLLNAVEADLNGLAKQKQALFKKYGKPGVDKDGKDNGTLTLVGATPEQIMAFNDDMAALLDTETTIPYEPIIWSKLGEKAQEKLTINDVRALGALLVEDEAAAGLPVTRSSQQDPER